MGRLRFAAWLGLKCGRCSRTNQTRWRLRRWPGRLLPDKAWPRRLAAYWTARDRFIEAGRAVRPSANVQAMLAQVREPLLSTLRISPDFRPAYDPLLQMALALSHTDTSSARVLLAELAQAQPARPEAAAALSRLGLH